MWMWWLWLWMWLYSLLTVGGGANGVCKKWAKMWIKQPHSHKDPFPYRSLLSWGEMRATLQIVAATRIPACILLPHFLGPTATARGCQLGAPRKIFTRSWGALKKYLTIIFHITMLKKKIS